MYLDADLGSNMYVSARGKMVLPAPLWVEDMTICSVLKHFSAV
jgi:hypothetical protein